jgi:uncharacterized caspase-like protein/GTPase SAR1 family protein
MSQQTTAVRYRERELYNNSFALVVGINNYNHEKIPNLTFAENDAKTVASSLPALGFPEENIKLLLGERAKVTAAAIRNVLETEFNPKMKEGDRFLFYFAGHGVSYKANKQVRGYLLLQGSELCGRWPSRSKLHLEKMPIKSWEMRQFLDFVSSLPVKHKLLLIDSCFSGFMTYTRGLFDGPDPDLSKKLAQWAREPVTQVITAGRSGQRAHEKEDYQHGVFTWYLLKGLEGNADPRGDGIISSLDLAAYICDRVSQEKFVEQDPQVGTYEGEGQFFFLYGKEAGNKLSIGFDKSDGVSKETSEIGAEAWKTYETLFGREEEIDTVISLLIDKKKPGLINIYGLGGVGKTSLVREMVERKHPERVVWLTAKKHYFEGDELYRNPLTESITLQQVYRKIAASFGPVYLEELAELKEKGKRIQWLQNLLIKEKRLVVVDNFETIDEDFKQFLTEIRLLFSVGPSRMVITSRFDLKKYPFVYNYKLNGLSENDTLALFFHELEKSSEGAGISIDNKKLKNIYTVTRGLPLAIKLIAARIRSSDIGALDYIMERLQNIKFTNEKELYETFYKFIYLDTWNSLSDHTRDLLVLMSALAPGEEVPVSYLHRIVVEAMNEPMLQEVFWKAFEEIKKYSLVDTRKSDPSMFSLHPLTQSFIKAEILQMDEHDEFKNL